MTGPLYARDKIQEMLDIAEPWKLIFFIAIGHADNKETRRKEKKDFSKKMIVLD